MAFWLLADLLILLASAAESISGRPAAGCQTRCGDVSIPYPFGIGPNCSHGKGFEIACDTRTRNGSGELVPTLAAANGTIHVQSLFVAPIPEVKVMLPVAYQCYNSSDSVTESFFGAVDLNNNGVYRISDKRNMFVVLGCNTMAYTNNGDSHGKGPYAGLYYTGCVSYCNDSSSAQDGMCAGIGCCHVDISPGLSDNVVTFGEWSRYFQVDFNPCNYAFLVAKDEYNFQRSDLQKDLNRTKPVWLDWAIRDGGNSSASSSCPAPEVREKMPPEYACVSDNSECVNSTNGPGYYCKCSKGYEGNPYLVGGCNDIDECARSDEYPCHGDCRNTVGDYHCKCRTGYQPRGGGPKIDECSQKFPLPAQIALGISLGFSFLIVAALFTLMMLQKRKINEYFKKNGGSILQKVDNIMIFSKDDLKKITKNNSHVIGQGGFGKVFKGTLEDNTMVAVKTSIEVNEARKEDFTNEVIIQSRMMHNNIIKLLGCCLEVDVPMLVYEFAANGSLQDILHGDANRSLLLTLDIRLDIAIESAEGLKYMHSSTNCTIRHGDVKPANILLTDKFVPKISDFGTSKLLTVDKDFTMFVVGSMGYIDPIFHKTGRLTQKSDVYSFGVVLLELISRKPTIYGENFSLIIEFQKAYDEVHSGRAMFDKEIAVEEDIFILEEIGKLAMECLKEKVEERPDMKEVAERLVMLRRARKHGQGSYNLSPRHHEEISIETTPTSFGADFSTNSSVSLSATCTPERKELYKL
ncbi:Os10g0151500 [Oryza sativa Japonica Group]|nr:Putative wall-associated protein kinase [Oryza sativa]AAP52142.1 Protein kinase domain containing protein [Oryza sativa Japonica Group]BAF26093.2 Os10g0151500 [Oryza sativa Japonica Group]|eukprot:NP_001064179.2 Os10g0151500 [Oryza sativa Japonica Group]